MVVTSLEGQEVVVGYATGGGFKPRRRDRGYRWGAPMYVSVTKTTLTSRFLLPGQYVLHTGGEGAPSCRCVLLFLQVLWAVLLVYIQVFSSTYNFV